MEPTLQKGTLTVWKDDRGFGFIEPEDDSQQVFLHISAVRKAVRRPQVGDTIVYARSRQTDGKLRAHNAYIQGVRLQTADSASQTRSIMPRRQQPRQLKGVVAPFVGLGVLVVGILLADVFTERLPPQSGKLQLQSDCVIKGNVSYNAGIKYYHLPGMEDYEGTVIDPGRGERWFCTEQEAIAAGWQRAPTP